MTITHYLAKVKDKRTLELPSEAAALGLQPGDEVRVSVEQDERDSAEPPLHPESQSLFDLLGDYIGSIEGNGENNSGRASELFTDYVVKKREEGRL